MCNACGFPTRAGAWTGAGSQSHADRVRAEMMQVAVINRLLRPMGLRATDGMGAPGFQLLGQTGARRIVDDLPSLWRGVEEMGGQPLDPLAPELFPELMNEDEAVPCA